MRLRFVALGLALLVSASAFAQTTLLWRKDHIYAGPGGPAIAIVTPAPSDQTAPNAPTGVGTSSVTSSSVTVGWTASTSGDVVGYKVFRQQGSGASLPVGTVGPGATSFVDQPLTPATGYTYSVRAFDEAQNHSAASGGANVTTASINDTVAPATPTGLAGYLLTRNSVRLTWEPQH